MTLEEQRQLVLSGAMYNDLTAELLDARERTVFLTNEYHASFGQPSEESETILKKLLKSIGKGVPCRIIREITDTDKSGYQPY